MEKYRRFFRVTSGPLLEEVERVEDINKVAAIEYKKILCDIGASDQYYHRDFRLCAVVFDTEPDKNLFKKVPSGWFPKKNSKKGKDICDRLSSVKTASQDRCLKKIGLRSSPTLFGNGKCWHSTLVIIPSDPKVCIVAVPWYDEDPSKIEQYKIDRANGTHMDMSLDAILWKPSSDMEEIKEWQYLKEIDEWNASIREESPGE